MKEPKRMPITFTKTELPGVITIQPAVFEDNRGFFMETYHQRTFREAGIQCNFVQDNYSHSRRSTLRGLHYQLENAQAKLIWVISGDVFDVVVDIRRGSPTFGQWMGVRLSDINRRQIFVPEGFAHGFCVLSETADVLYKCSDLYSPGDEHGVIWNDPSIGIEWPIDTPIISKKDGENPRLSEIPEDVLPLYDT